MIKIEISKDKISISGHANYDEFGKDIVCAAVSSTVITTINGILSINSSAIKVEEKEPLVIEILKHDDVVDKLIDNMISLLEELKKDYNDNIYIRRC